MIRKLTVVFSALLLYNAVSGQPLTDLHRLDSTLTALHLTHRFNGTILYAENGKILYKKALGVTDCRTGEALQLDDPVRKYIPELPYEGITLRHLLTHTSGIPEYFDLFLQYRGTLDTLNNESMIRLFARVHPGLDFPTGSSILPIWMG